MLLNDTGFEVTKFYLTEEKSRMKGMLVIAANKIEISDHPKLLVKPRIVGSDS